MKWTREEMATTQLKNDKIAELEANAEKHRPEVEELQAQVATLSANNAELRQQMRTTSTAEAQLKSIIDAVKVKMHGTSVTHCKITVVNKHDSKKRKRGDDGNSIVFQCSCGQTLPLGQEHGKSSFFGGWF